MNPAAARQVQASMHNVLRVAVRPLLAAQQAALDWPQAVGAQPVAADTVCRAVPALLTARGLVDALPPELRRQLSAGAGLERCCRWLQLLLSPAQPPMEKHGGSVIVNTRASSSGQTAISAEDAASGMCNLALLTLTAVPLTVSTEMNHLLPRAALHCPSSLANLPSSADRRALLGGIRV